MHRSSGILSLSTIGRYRVQASISQPSRLLILKSVHWILNLGWAHLSIKLYQSRILSHLASSTTPAHALFTAAHTDWLIPAVLIEAASSWVKFYTSVSGLFRSLIPVMGLKAMSQLSQLQTLKDFYFRKCWFYHKGRVIGYISAGKFASRWFIISKFSALSMIAHMFLSMSQHPIQSLPVPLFDWIEHLISPAILIIMIRSWAWFQPCLLPAIRDENLFKALKEAFLLSTCILCWTVTRINVSFLSYYIFQDFRIRLCH